MHTIYTGEQVKLRPWRDREEYARAVIETTLEPNPWWGPEWYPGSKEYFDGAGMLHTNGHSSFALELADGTEWVGFEDCGGLSVAGLAAWVGTYILPKHQGRGYGTEAKQLMLCYLFENYAIQVVWADTTETHGPARTSLDRCGMHYFGCRRGAIVSNGKYANQVYYRIFREEWEAMSYRHKVARG